MGIIAFSWCTILAYCYFRSSMANKVPTTNVLIHPLNYVRRWMWTIVSAFLAIKTAFTIQALLWALLKRTVLSAPDISSSFCHLHLLYHIHVPLSLSLPQTRMIELPHWLLASQGYSSGFLCSVMLPLNHSVEHDSSAVVNGVYQ